MSAYRRDFDKTKCMSFFIKYENFLEKYNKVWDKVSNSIKKSLIVNLCIIKKYLKKQNKILQGKNQHKKGSQCIYISVILIDSTYRKDKNYYQVSLKKYKYVVK